MAAMRGFIVYPGNTIIDNTSYVQLFGRLENGQSFACLNRFTPYFFIRQEDEKKLKDVLSKEDFSTHAGVPESATGRSPDGQKLKIEKTESKTFNGEKVIKLIFNNQTELNKFAKDLHEAEFITYEADVKPEYRFIIDNDLRGEIEIDGEWESSERVERVYRDASIKGVYDSEEKVDLRVASIDIESGKDGKLFCVGIYSRNKQVVFMVTSNKIEGVVSCKNEEDCLEKFKAEIIKIDPDIITGWNVIDFDFNFLKGLFQKNKVSFDLGRTNENAKIRIEESFFRSSKMDIPGRLVLDGLNFIRDPFIQEAPSIKNIKFESFTLDEVSRQILGKSKLIHGKDRCLEIEDLYLGDSIKQKKLAEYNLRDCELVYDIIEKIKILDLSVGRSRLTGMPLDRLTSSIASFDSLYIREARKKGLVSPTTRFNQKEQKIKGGFVMSPKPGIYHNVLVMDFKSLYPSIIKTFNIDPASFLTKSQKGAIESPNGAFFKNQEGILPAIIQRLHEAREKAKKEKKELSSYAIKIIMNSFFGVLASPNCRYFNMKMGNAITNFGQEIIKLTAKEIEKEGFKVIYGDTDSVFVTSGEDEKNSEKTGYKIADKIDKFYENYVKQKYSRKSYLDLEFDKLYLALIMPRTRLSANEDEEGEESKGAKKRYAGLVLEDGKEVLDIVGLEAIRGDWTEVAQQFQRDLLMKVFKKQNPTSFIREVVESIRKGKLDSQLVYRKSIRKELEEYTKTTPPHVKAARKLDKLEGNVIEYLITLDGPEPIQKLKHKIDYEHYIEKQIKPIAKTILETRGIDFESVFEGSKQRKLF